MDPSNSNTLFSPATWAAIGSFIVAAAALALAVITNSTAKRRERSILYMDLKSRFSEVYKELGPVYRQDTLPENEDEQLKLFAYWHHSFDEWYSTVKLGQKLQKELWNNYFSYQIVSGLKHGALREAYLCVSQFDRELGGPYRQELCDAVELAYEKIYNARIPKHESVVLRELMGKTKKENV